jgi:molybdate transport system ATP-binding protein
VSGELEFELSVRAGTLSLQLALRVGAEVLALVGPNGAGKTTLLLALLGVRRPESGRIALGDRPLYDSERAIDVPIEQRRLSYVPQDYSLFPHLSALAQVEFALAERGVDSSGRGRRQRAQTWLRELGVEALADRKPATLSGGERQRVALARALARAPGALLLDEPLAALDVRTRELVRSFLRAKLRELALPTIVVTHDPKDALALADRIAVLEAGQLTQLGAFEALASAPRSAYVASFVAGEPRSISPAARTATDPQISDP